MGAYLHILDGLPEACTDSESIHYLNQTGRRTGRRNFTSARDITSSHWISKKERSSSSGENMDDCSSFWAGQLDDCFEDLRTRRSETPAGRKGYSTREGRMGRKEGEMSSSMISSRAVLDSGESPAFSRSDFPKRKATENMVLVDDAEYMDVDYSGAEFSGTRDAQITCMVVEKVNRNEASVQPLGGKLSAETEGGALVDVEDAGFDDATEGLPDHLLIEVLIRVPVRDWPAAACVKKRWGQLFGGDGFWHSALMKQWPRAGLTKRWPGPISRGSSKRRFIALYVSNSVFMKEKVEGIDEVAGHVYLFLKEQLESSTPPASYGLLHGTIIDQFLACSKTGDDAHELASLIWVAVLDNLDDTENTFHLLMRLAEEWEVFLPYPYTKSNAVQWRLFERLFTDFRDCLSQYNYFDVLTRAKYKFDLIPPTWLGY